MKYSHTASKLLTFFFQPYTLMYIGKNVSLQLISAENSVCKLLTASVKVLINLFPTRLKHGTLTISQAPRSTIKHRYRASSGARAVTCRVEALAQNHSLHDLSVTQRTNTTSHRVTHGIATVSQLLL